MSPFSASCLSVHSFIDSFIVCLFPHFPTLKLYLLVWEGGEGGGGEEAQSLSQDSLPFQRKEIKPQGGK